MDDNNTEQMCEDCGEKPATFTIMEPEDDLDNDTEVRLCHNCVAHH